jgi:hypothetical protein
MNIIELAKQAGFVIDQDAQKYQPQCIEATHRMIDEPLKIFAALVAAHEREECAKIAAETVCDVHLPTGTKIYGSRVATTIRARSNTCQALLQND